MTCSIAKQGALNALPGFLALVGHAVERGWSTAPALGLLGRASDPLRKVVAQAAEIRSGSPGTRAGE
jgi:hypothetical protein